MTMRLGQYSRNATHPGRLSQLLTGINSRVIDMAQEYRKIEPAKTLLDLENRIGEAIMLAGKTATWNGWDDGSIVIHSEDDSVWLQIDCKGD